MSEELLSYSIQRTYILTSVSTPEKRIITCNERIDIPTIEPLTGVKTVVYSDKFSKIIPCIELAGRFLDEFKFAFETNEGVTVLPVNIYPGTANPLDNPYQHFRYVFVLPRGATGVKSCKIIHTATGKEVQHNLTFGVMPPPYNYDNALFGYLSYGVNKNSKDISALTEKVNLLKLTEKSPIFSGMFLDKGQGKQTINIEHGELFFETTFSYSSSPEPTIHKPKITLRGGDFINHVYTLSLSRATNNVSIDLFTGMITVYASVTGEIMEQFKLPSVPNGFQTLSFENFDDIDVSAIYVKPRGVRVE